MNLTQLLTHIAVGTTITLLVSFLLRNVFPKLTRKTPGDFDDFVLRTLSESILPFGAVVVLLLIQSDLGLSNDVQRAYDVLLRIFGTVVIVRFANRVGIRFLQGVAHRLSLIHI